MYAYANTTELLLHRIIILNSYIYSILQARLYEVVYEVYQIIIPVYVAKRQFRELEKIHVKLVECFQNIVSKVTSAIFVNHHTMESDYREIKEVLELTTGLVSMAIFLVKVFMDRSSSIVNKVSPDWLNSY